MTINVEKIKLLKQNESEWNKELVLIRKENTLLSTKNVTLVAEINASKHENDTLLYNIETNNDNYDFINKQLSMKTEQIET